MREGRGQVSGCLGVAVAVVGGSGVVVGDTRQGLGAPQAGQTLQRDWCDGRRGHFARPSLGLHVVPVARGEKEGCKKSF